MIYMVKGSCEQTITVDGEETTVEVNFKGGAHWEGGGMLSFSKPPKYTHLVGDKEIKGVVEKIPPGTKLHFDKDGYIQKLKVVETDGVKCMVHKML